MENRVYRSQKTASQILKNYIRHLTIEDLRARGAALEPTEEQILENTYDNMNEVRCGKVETDIAPAYSRNYETKSVAMYFEDFEGFTGWIGWTYMSGGGKHGCPELYDWISDAYFLDLVSEKEVVIIKRTFEKAEV